MTDAYAGVRSPASEMPRDELKVVKRQQVVISGLPPEGQPPHGEPGSCSNPIQPSPLPRSDFAVKLYISDGIVPPTDYDPALYERVYGHLRRGRVRR